jgi:hypothetical protein
MIVIEIPRRLAAGMLVGLMLWAGALGVLATPAAPAPAVTGTPAP